MNRQISIFAATFCFSLAGCGGGEVRKEEMSKSYDALTKGDEAYNRKDYAAALPLLTEAVAKSNLQADILADAYRKKAVCEIEAGKLEEAEKDLGLAEQGGATNVFYYDAMGRLYLKKGDKTKADENFAKAKQGDRSYVPPSSGS